MLAGVFDRVVHVPLLEHACVPLKTKKQQIIYGSWIEKSFTKWNIMNPALFPLDRVCLLDADVNVLAPIDDIFDLSAPAATFSTPWVGPYTEADSMQCNPYVDRVEGRIVELAHGAIVDPARIERGLREAIVGCANMVLLAPSQRAYDLMLMRMQEHPKFGNSRCQSGHDEQLLARVWLDMGEPITHIHQEYNWYVGKTNWLRLAPDARPRTHQFYNGKPWREIADPADRARIAYDDVNAWWAVADTLMADNEEWKAWFYRGWGRMQSGHPSSMLERAPARKKQTRPRRRVTYRK